MWHSNRRTYIGIALSVLLGMLVASPADAAPKGQGGTPVVQSVSPSSGPTSGGTGVTLTGKNFAAGAQVTFGGAAATNVTVRSSRKITATTPAHSAGTVDVTVTNPDGKSGTKTGGFTYTAPPQPPAAPSNVTATPVSSSQINLAWTDNATNEDGFEIERSTDGTTFTLLAKVGTNVTTYSNTGLTASTTYYYRVRAYNADGKSDYSNTASGTTLEAPAPALPAAPTNLTATAASSSKINLTWTDNATNEDGFEIERSLDGASFSLRATVGANVTSYSDTGLAASTTYYYRVRAYNSAGKSDYSNTASAMTTNDPLTDEEKANGKFVAPWGNDANPGTVEKPFRTVQKAADVVQAGKTVYIRDGTYHERVIIKSSGSATAGYVTFRNYPGETAILDGQKNLPVDGDSWKGLLNVYQNDYIRFQGLMLRNSHRYGIYVSSSVDHLEIDNNIVEYSDHGGIVIGPYNGYATNVIVSHNTVRYNNDIGLTAGNEAITIRAVDTFEVSYNNVHDNKEEGIDLKGGATNGKVHHNHVHHNNGPNIYVDSANTIDIYNNEVHHDTGNKAGIMLGVEGWASPEVTHHIDIYNNTIYEGYTGIRFYIGSDAASYGTINDCRIFNNTIYANKLRGGLWIYASQEPALDFMGNAIFNNIFWKNDWNELNDGTSQNFQGYNIHDNLFATNATSETFGQNPVMTDDVRFVDAPKYDLHVKTDSPAIDRGYGSGAPDTDMDDVQRPLKATYDIGADERE